MRPLTANCQIALSSFLDQPSANRANVDTKKLDTLEPEYRPHRTIFR